MRSCIATLGCLTYLASLRSEGSNVGAGLELVLGMLAPDVDVSCETS